MCVVCCLSLVLSQLWCCSIWLEVTQYCATRSPPGVAADFSPEPLLTLALPSEMLFATTLCLLAVSTSAPQKLTLQIWNRSSAFARTSTHPLGQTEEEMKEKKEETLLPFSLTHYTCNTGWNAMHLLIAVSQMACNLGILMSQHEDEVWDVWWAKASKIQPSLQNFGSALVIHDFLTNYSAPISDAYDFYLAQCLAVFEETLGENAFWQHNLI